MLEVARGTGPARAASEGPGAGEVRRSHRQRREGGLSGHPWGEDFHAAQTDGAPPGDTVTRAPAPTQAVAAPRPPRPPRALQVAAAVLGVVLLVMVALLLTRTTGPSRADVAVGGTPGSTAPTASPSPSRGTAATDAAATAELEALRRKGLVAHPPTGQWVAQLSAKSVGTTDPVQTASNGSSTFYAADILAQSREIASGVAGGDVFVLRTSDFGDGLLDARGNPYWVTLAAGPFGDAGDVRTWCDSMFSTTPADVRGNVCLPKQLTPPR